MLCSCGREGQKVVYVCKGSMGACPDFVKQTYYCILCSQDEGRHEHKAIAIVTEIEAEQARWQALLADVAAAIQGLSGAAGERRNLEPLIAYLEGRMRTLGRDFEPLKRPNKDEKAFLLSNLKRLLSDVLATYEQQVEPVLKGMRFQELNLLYR